MRSIIIMTFYRIKFKGEKALLQTKLCAFLKSANTVFLTRAIKQRWKNSSYSYNKSRPANGLLFIISGDCIIKTANNSFTAKSGDIIFLPKHSLYDAIFPNETYDYLIDFDSEYEEVSIKNPFVFLQNATVETKEHFSLITEKSIHGDCGKLWLNAAFYLMLDNITSSCQAQNIKSQTVEKAKELLKSEENFSFEEIARMCNISESGLRKKFKEKTGVSPAAFKLNFKIDNAKYLLESTNMTNSQIADYLQFYDTAHFNRVFKKTTGLTPKEFSKLKQL